MTKTKHTTEKVDALAVVKKDTAKIVLLAEQFEIKDAATLEEATEILSKIKTAQKNVKTEEDKVLKPALAVVEAERGRWRPLKTQLQVAEDTFKGKMVQYMEAEAERQAKEEAKIKKDLASGKIKNEGTALRKLSNVEQAPKSVSTASGASINTREVDEFHYDVNLIPRDYLLPNEALIKAAIKSGKTVEGVTVTKKKVIAAR